MNKNILVFKPETAEFLKAQNLLDKVGDYIIISSPPEIKEDFVYFSEAKEGKDLVSQIRKFDKRRRRY